jgi:hypothetical protein
MAKQKDPYRYIVVETFETGGRHRAVHTRPIPGQAYPTQLRVERPAGLEKYPVGTQFRIRAKLSSLKGGTKYLKSHHSWEFEVLPKCKLHIVQGDIKVDKKSLERTAGTHRSIATWIVPKSANIGDDVVVFIGGYGFFATALIKTATESRKDWKKRYGAGLAAIKLISPPISLSAIRRHIPKLLWAKYPRSIHTTSDLIANQVRKIIQDRRKSGIPDLDDRALTGANVDELRRVALLSARKAVPGLQAKTIARARSRAIHLYVVRRADGRCEGCNAKAPFLKVDGFPYLEPHHITRLADEGPDHPAKVIALCPNCHRRAHSSLDKTAFNRYLKKTLKALEPRR